MVWLSEDNTFSALPKLSALAFLSPPERQDTPSLASLAAPVRCRLLVTATLPSVMRPCTSASAPGAGHGRQPAGCPGRAGVAGSSRRCLGMRGTSDAARMAGVAPHLPELSVVSFLHHFERATRTTSRVASWIAACSSGSLGFLFPSALPLTNPTAHTHDSKAGKK